MASNRFMKSADIEDDFPFRSLAAITAEALQAQKTKGDKASDVHARSAYGHDAGSSSRGGKKSSAVS